MSRINIKQKLPPKESDSNNALTKMRKLLLKIQEEAQVGLQATNMVTGGAIHAMVHQPRWYGKLKKAGFIVLDFFKEDNDRDLSLVFQYNPRNVHESRKVLYEVDNNIFRGDFRTTFKHVDPIVIELQFIVDAFNDLPMTEIEQQILKGATQSAFMMAGMDTRGLSELSYANSAVGDLTEGKTVFDRNVIDAMENIRRLTSLGEDVYYKYEDGKFIASDDKEGTLKVSKPPYRVRLDWKGYENTVFVVNQLEINAVKFDTRTLKPLRSEVRMQLLEYNNPFQDAVDKLDGDKLTDLFKGN